MLTSIQFNDKFGFWTSEVRDVVSYRVLPAEGNSQLVVSNSRPKFALGGS
jgi:hypothetical protein